MNEKTRNIEAWREGVSAGESCLSLDALQEFVSGGASDPKGVQHLASCPHCQAELAMLRSFESSVQVGDDQEAVAWVAAQLQRAQGIAPLPVRVPFWRGWLRAPQLAGAAIVLLIGLGLSLYVSTRQERPLLHGEPSGNQNMRSGDIRLMEPSGDSHQAPEDFRWEAFPRAKVYTIQLLEVDGTVLWSGQSSENVLITTPELRAKMRPGKALLWKVIALDASGEPISSSSAERFRVTAEKPR